MSMTRRNSPPLNERGMALIGVLVLSALLMSLAIALALAVRSDQQMRGAFGSSITGFYAAESGLNMGMGEYRNIFLEYNVPSGNDFNPRTLTVGNRTVTYKLSERAGNPQNIVIPSGELFSGLNAIQYRYIVNSTATNASGDVEAGVGAEFLVGYIPLFQFVAFYKNDLEILPGPNMTLNGRVHTNGKLYLSSSGNTLTIADNPAQGVYTVQVSAGQGVYRGRKDTTVCDGTVTIDMLEDKVAPFGDLDPKTLPCNGTTTRLVPQSELADWKGSIISNIGNIAIPEPDIILPPTSVSNGGTANPGVYWDKADLRIVAHPGVAGPALGGGPAGLMLIDVVTAAGVQDATKTTALRNFMMDGRWNEGELASKGPSRMRGTMPIFYTDVPNAASNCGPGVYSGACTHINRTNYTPNLPDRTGYTGNNANSGAYAEAMGPGFLGGAAVATFDGDYRRGGFYNHREKKWMLLLNINIRDLILWNKENGEPFFAHNDNTEGGLVIFATVAGPNSNSTNNNYGVRIFGSNDIPLTGGIGISADPTGVTVATDQAMYVIGDYNRGTVNGGVARQPASIIGDSINVMSSNYWRSGAAGCTDQRCRDGQSSLDLTGGRRTGANTWINAAFLGGVSNSAVGNYNGGLENYPRFHEDWSGTTLNYQGSFVSLGDTKHVNGAWCGTGGSNSSGCNIYNPPTRAWNFDPAFNNAANLPPLTPRFVYVQQVLFTEDFK
ncbi:pilus assembly PilX N-terminal domain-containing protein [bacterium]|nr:pilus assembly PilX N-terminal domain-containing protein [bacterium]